MADDDHHHLEEAITLRCRAVQLETELRIVKKQYIQAQHGGLMVVNLLSNNAFSTPQPMLDAQKPSSSTKVDTITLHCHIAALETELHFAKEQLAATQSGSVYLINLLGSHESLIAPAQRFGRLLGENVLHQGGESTPQRSDSLLDGGSELLHFDGRGWGAGGQNSAMPSVDTGGVMSAEDSTIPPGFTPSMQTQSAGVEDEADAGPFGLGTEGVTYPPSVTEAPLIVEASQVATPSDEHEMITSNGEKIRFSIPKPQPPPGPMIRHTRPEYREQPSRLQARVSRFHDREHAWLRGVACFVDDLANDELEEYWNSFAKAHPGHTATEWREYFEGVVQSKWREEQARRRPDHATLEGSIDTSKVDESNLLTNLEIESEDLLGDDPTDEEPISADVERVSPEKTEQPTPSELDKGASYEPQAPQNTLEHPEGDPEIATKTKPFAEQKSDRSPPGLASSMHAPASLEVVAQPNAAPGVPSLRGNDDQLNEAKAFLRSATRGGGKRSNDRQRDRGNNGPSRHSPPSVMTAKTNLPWKIDLFDLQTFTQIESEWSRIWDEETVHMVCNEYVGNGLSSDPTKRRTVLIQDVPASITLADVLDHVRGGRIINAKFAATGLMTTSPPMGNTVIVEFQGSTNAQRFVQSCARSPIVINTANGEQIKASVNLIETPSRPIHWTIVKGLREENLSRVVYLLGDCKLMTCDDVVDKILAADHRITAPLKAEFDNDGILLLEFASIVDAGNASIALKSLPDFKGMQKGFMADPCSLPPRYAETVEGMVDGDGEVTWQMVGESSARIQPKPEQGCDVPEVIVSLPTKAATETVADPRSCTVVVNPDEIDLFGSMPEMLGAAA